MYRLTQFLLPLLALGLVACSDGNNGNNSPSGPTAFELAQQNYLQATVDDSRGGAYGALAHVALGVAPVEGSYDDDLWQMNNREDTADFSLPALMMLLHRFADSEALDPALKAEIEQEVIRFKFWPDELEEVPGTSDALEMVTWTENHYILFTSGAYLAGQLYPDTVFPASGRTGAEQMATFRPRVLKWLEMRYRSGFSEWLSNVYYNEDMPALVALIELAEDEEIVEKSKIVLDLMFADLALNTFQGGFNSTHGRTYTHKMDSNRDSTRAAVNLAYGLHTQTSGNFTATMLALSEKYRVPEVLHRIANDVETPAMENRQRMGINLEEVEDWGLSLDPNNLEDAMQLITMEPYPHPLYIDVFYEMLTAFGWWEYRDFEPFNTYRFILDDPVARAGAAASFEFDITRNMRPEVNIYTYRTPSYMLSTAQDWRKGFGGDQSSIWQATIGSREAVAFTTHPGAERTDGGTPNYWVGYGTLPRAAQVKNVVISLYDIETREGLYYPTQPMYTHAFLPRGRFDESTREGQWFFARKGDAYLALWSSDPNSDWLPTDDPNAHGGGDYEIIADGEKTIWICELGDAGEYGDFDSFRSAISGATLNADAEALTVSYDSPSQGLIEMGWNGDVLNNGVAVALDGYGRFENPWSDSSFPGEQIRFTYGDSYLELDFDGLMRDASAFME